MSNYLHRENESIFFDLSVLFTTDWFVLQKIYKYLFRTNDTNDLFYELKDQVESDLVGYQNISKLAQIKSFPNPLMDYMVNPDESTADNYYNGILLDDEITQETYFTDLFKTNIGKSLDQLLKDSNLTSVYVHVASPAENMLTFIHMSYANIDKSKINFVIGNKEDFLKDIPCDNYFFNNIDDIQFIMNIDRDKDCCVYTPEYSYNMRTDKPAMVRVPIPLEELTSNNKICVNTIKLPLF